MVNEAKYASRIINSIQSKSPKYWANESKKTTLNLFHKMAIQVPAYKDFLKRHKIKHKSIENFSELGLVPEITKNNYLRKYSLKDLSWEGQRKKPTVLTSTSGSTGAPVYFSRGHELNLQSSIIHELYFENRGFNKKEPTLIIIAFGMGVWIGGLITFQAFDLMQKRGFPLSIIAPGINKKEILKILRDIAPNYNQILIAGYPPFIKDIIDEAPRRKINLKKFNLRLLFAAELFTDRFRDYVSKKAGIRNQFLDTMNIYGTAELGTMAFETPLSIFIRKNISSRPKLFNDIFPAVTKTPILAQYISSFTNFDEVDNKILISGNSTIPLLRYSLGDCGGVISFKEMEGMFSSHGINLEKEMRINKLISYFYKLPFVYVYERSDFSTTLYGLRIYPESVREILLSKPYDSVFTGKFTLITKFDRKQNQYLEINLEVQHNKKVTKALEMKLTSDIEKNLRSKSSEFRELSDYLNDESKPRLMFWPTEDPLYFKPGTKQKWVTM